VNWYLGADGKTVFASNSDPAHVRVVATIHSPQDAALIVSAPELLKAAEACLVASQAAIAKARA